MIVLDTNVLSQPGRPMPEPAVLAWLDRQHPEGLYSTSINVMELLEGVGRLPEGARRRSLEAANHKVLAALEDRILPFDHPAAAACAELMNAARRRGFNIGIADCMIGAVASMRGFAVATWDEAPFRAMALDVVNPWTT